MSLNTQRDAVCGWLRSTTRRHGLPLAGRRRRCPLRGRRVSSHWSVGSTRFQIDRAAGTPPLPHKQPDGGPAGLSGLVVALAVTAFSAQWAAGRGGAHVRDADVLHDVTQVVQDRVPVVVGRLLVPLCEPDEAEGQLLRDLLVMVGITHHQHAPWVVTRGPEPARDDVGLGRRAGVGDPEDLVEVTRDGVRGHLGVEHVRDGGGDEDLFHTQTPDRGQGGVSPAMQLGLPDAGGEQLKIKSSGHSEVASLMPRRA